MKTKNTLYVWQDIGIHKSGAYFMRVSTLACTMWLSIASTLANAHDTWIWPVQRTVQPGVTMNFEMTSSDTFPLPDSAIRPERIAKSACRQDGMQFQLTPVPPAKVVGVQPKLLALTALPPREGSVICWSQLYAKILDLDLKKVEIYLNDIDASAEIRAAWESTPKPKRWIESYTKNSKVIIPVAAKTTAASKVAPPVGLALEFVPEVDLSTGVFEKTLPVLVLRDGKPLAGLSVALTSERGILTKRVRTDKAGRAIFDAPTEGRWMLSATDLRLVNKTKSIWESQFSTLVFEVLPKK